MKVLIIAAAVLAVLCGLLVAALVYAAGVISRLEEQLDPIDWEDWADDR